VFTSNLISQTTWLKVKLKLVNSCLVRLSLIFFLNGTIDCHFISDIMDYFLAGKDQQQTNQPNDLAGG